MTPESDLRRLSIAGLAHRCAQETELFFQRQSYDPRYCFELFRRAIAGQNQRAWELVYDQYLSLVAGWVQRHPAFEASREEVQYLANCAFEKMWASVTPDKFSRFSDLKSLLRYLQMCVHSVIVDHIRLADHAILDDPVEAPAMERRAHGPAIEDQALDRVHHEEFWRWLNERLHDDKERQVVYGSFILGLKPRDLYDQFRDTFSDVDEVYRVKQNVLARLRRDPDFQKFLDEDA